MNSGALSIFSLFVTRMADPNETALALSSEDGLASGLNTGAGAPRFSAPIRRAPA